MPRLTRRTAALLAAACAAVAGCGRDRPAAVCAAPGVEVRGSGGRCEGATARALAGLVDARELVPADVRPATLVVELDPALPAGARPIDVIETHRPTGVIRVDGAAVDRIDRGMWLHEIAHVLMGDRRPDGELGRRLMVAVEEGAADYAAARMAGTAVIGGRDLTAAPRAAIEWERLAVEPAAFDAHAAGHLLAARLWAARPPWRDVLACSRGARYGGVADTPAAVLGAWAAGCPDRSRGAIEQLVRAWAPGSW